MARVEPVLGEQVGLRDLPVPAGQSVEDPAVRHGAARHGLDVPEVRVGQAQADGGVRAPSVGGLQHHESAPGADEGGSGAQQLLEGVGQGVRTGQPLGELMERGEVGDPAGETVLQEQSGGTRGGRDGDGSGDCGLRGHGRGRDSVCGRGNR